MALWAGLLFFNHQLSLGGWLVASGFAFTIFGGLWEITSAITQLKSTKQLRDQTAALRKRESNLAINAAGPEVCAVQVKNLVVAYGHHETISYPDFSVKAGDKVLLTGDSGTGKSTLFKVLLGQMMPAQGQVIYTDAQNHPIEHPNLAQVGYIAQDATLFPDTIANNVTMFNSKLNQQVATVVNKVQLSADMAQLPAGVETQVDLDQDNLSGGQKQKVVLARAQIHQAKLILMDEATSAIDHEATQKILATLLKSDCTVILIAHNFSEDLRKQFDAEIQLSQNKKEA